MPYNSVTPVISNTTKNDSFGDLQSTVTDQVAIDTTHMSAQVKNIAWSWRDKVKSNKHRQDTSNQNLSTCIDTPMFTAIYPFLFSLKLVGLFHVRSSGKCNISFLYQVFVMILLGLQVCQNGFVFSDSLSDISYQSLGDPDLFTKVLVCIWHISCALNSVAFFRASYHNHISEFIMEWSLIRHTTTEVLKVARRKTIVFTTVCWLVILANICFTVYGAYFTYVFDYTLLPMKPTHPHIHIYRGVMLVMTLYLSSAWIFPVAFTMLACSILHTEFTTLTKDFLGSASDSTSVSELDVEEHRLRHQQLCRLVGHADNVLSLHLAISFIQGDTVLILLFYNILHHPIILKEPMTLVMHLFWMVSICVQLFLDAVGPAQVNSAVSMCYCNKSFKVKLEE